MPLFSDHISSIYYSGSPLYSSSSYGYNSSVSPLGNSYSASYLNPGGNYSNHSSLGSYSRTPLTSRWISGVGRSYSPMLSTISERSTASPVRINSPRRIPITKRSYGSSGYITRPININTADIDVSKDKYRKKAESPVKSLPQRKESPRNEKETENSPFMPRVDGKPETGIDSSPGVPRSTIKRGRTVVRLHTIRRKDRDSPRKPTQSLQTQEATDITDNAAVKQEQDTQSESQQSTSWRERLSDDLVYKDKKAKKTLGTKLAEKFMFKDTNKEDTPQDIPIEKILTQTDGNQSLPTTPLPGTSKLPDRRCSLEILAEQAKLLDSLIRKENLSTAPLDLSKVGILDEPKTEVISFKPIKRRKSNDKHNPLKTTQSDHSLHDSLKSFHGQDGGKNLSKKRSLKKSSSGGSICRLDSITEFPKEPLNINLPPIDEIKSEAAVVKLKPKLKTKITASVDVSPPKSPLKFRIDEVVVEEKPRTLKKGITFSSTVDEIPMQIITTLKNGQYEESHNNNNITKKTHQSELPSPEPEDGNFWNKIGKRETVYLMKRKQILQDAKEKHKRPFFWLPEEENLNENDAEEYKDALQEHDDVSNTPINFNINSEHKGTSILSRTELNQSNYLSDINANTLDSVAMKNSDTTECTLKGVLKKNKTKDFQKEGITEQSTKNEVFINKQIKTFQQEEKALENQGISKSSQSDSVIHKEMNLLCQKENICDNKKENVEEDLFKDPSIKSMSTKQTKEACSIEATLKKKESPAKKEIMKNKETSTKEKETPIKKIENPTKEETSSNKASSRKEEILTFKETPPKEETLKNKESPSKEEILQNNEIMPKEETLINSETLSNDESLRNKAFPLKEEMLTSKKTPANKETLKNKGSASKEKTLKNNEILPKEETLINSETLSKKETLKKTPSKDILVKNKGSPKTEMILKRNVLSKSQQEQKSTKIKDTKHSSYEQDEEQQVCSLLVKAISDACTELQHLQNDKEELTPDSKVDQIKCLLENHDIDVKEMNKVEKLELVTKLNKTDEQDSKISFANIDDSCGKSSKKIEIDKKHSSLKIKEKLSKTESTPTKVKSYSKNSFKKSKSNKTCEKQMSTINKDNSLKELDLNIVNVPEDVKDQNMNELGLLTISPDKTEQDVQTPNLLDEKEQLLLIPNENTVQKLAESLASHLEEQSASKVKNLSDDSVSSSNNISEMQVAIEKPENIPINENQFKRSEVQETIATENNIEAESVIKKDDEAKEPEVNLPVVKLPDPPTAKKPVKQEAALRPLIATPRPLQKRAPQVIHSSESSDSSSEEETSDEEDGECDASEGSEEFFECETNPDGRTSTGSNDSGFDSSAPTSPAGFHEIRKDCDVNCHRKCEKLTANLCGVNQRLLVEALATRTASKKGADVPGTSTCVAVHNNSTDILEQELEQSTAYGIFRKTGRFTPPARSIPRFRKYTIEDFHFIKVLGKGSFGKVLLAELRDTEYYYAVKCLKKDVVLEDDDVECTLIERKVLALGTNHPYLCHLFATFQTDSHLFFVMEYLNGGDLMFHIQQSGRFPEARARFYAAEIVSGLKFLHKRGIIYRDLKLDNILLDFDGHVRIADFGMCKLQIYLDKTADTFCGTPDYMAPEIIKGLKYNQTVDWWSFGVLLYEMLIGQSPFSGCDEDELFWSICNEMPSYPRFLSQEGLTILTRLLDKDARTRLGGTECMHGDIKEQAFFHSIHWDRLERRDLEAPFRPRVRHPMDTQYFDRAFTGERPRLTAVEPQVLRSMDQEPFRGFSYTNPNATDR